MGKIQKGKIVEKGACEHEGHAKIHTIEAGDGKIHKLPAEEFGDSNKVYDCLLTSPTGPQSVLNMCEACLEISELCGFEVINSDLELVK
jgi:hypothetical protein